MKVLRKPEGSVEWSAFAMVNPFHRGASSVQYLAWRCHVGVVTLVCLVEKWHFATAVEQPIDTGHSEDVELHWFNSEGSKIWQAGYA